MLASRRATRRAHGDRGASIATIAKERLHAIDGVGPLGAASRQEPDMNENQTSPTLDRIISWSLRHPMTRPAQYLIAATSIVAVGIFRAFVVSAIVPWLLFIPVVMMLGLLSGRKVGVHAAFLAAIVAAVSIGHVEQPGWLTVPQWTGSLMFLLVASGIAVLSAELRAAFARITHLASENEASRATLRAVFESAPVGLSLAAGSGESLLINEQMRVMLGRDISKGGLDRYLDAGAIHDDGSRYTLAQYPQVDAISHGIETRAAPFLIERPDGTRLRTEISSVPLRTPSGAIAGAVSVIVDVEERERAVEHQTLLIGELAHRMKNTMAMVQAIVHQSLRSAETLAEARENVVSRFEALVRAQDLLTRGDWKAADLGHVVRGALETIDDPARLTIAGETVIVGARAALSLTLVMHELATNAVKYGALSVPGGRVDMRWRRTIVDDAERVVLTWEEHGGPEVAVPSRQGFGTRLIDTMGRTFGGRSELSYNTAGLRWTVDADARQLGTM